MGVYCKGSRERGPQTRYGGGREGGGKKEDNGQKSPAINHEGGATEPRLFFVLGGGRPDSPVKSVPG